MTGPFSAQDVARILKLSPERLRACVRAAGLSPRTPQFTFEHLLLLKTARGLLDARIPAARIRRMLDSLQRQLPDGRHLSSVTIYADGRRVVVWDGTTRWQPDSGQFLFNFSPASMGRASAFPVHRQIDPVPARTAQDWVELALEIEPDSPDEARLAYRHALAADPDRVDACINLGRLCQQDGDLDGAEAWYRRALTSAPGDAVARFNLAVLLEARGQAAAAIEQYRLAIREDPGLRDAHHNLALLYETEGQGADAIRHWQIVRALDRPGHPATRRRKYRKACTPAPDTRPD